MERLLARARRVGKLLFGTPALGEQRLEPLLHPAPPGGRRTAPRSERHEPLLQPSEVDLRDTSPEARELEPELLRPLGRGRLQRERPEALANLRLDIACTLDLDRDASKLELGPVPTRLEATEACGFLDQHAPFGRPRREDRLDLPLADDRVHALAQPEVGEQLHEVEAAHGGPVDEVPPLAAAVQPARDRELRVVDGQRAVGVVEEKLDLAEVGSATRAAAGEENVVRFLGAQLGRAEGACRPADRVGDVGLAGAVRSDDHPHARLETDLDRVGKRLEATQLDRTEVHAPVTLTRSADATRRRLRRARGPRPGRRARLRRRSRGSPEARNRAPPP